MPAHLSRRSLPGAGLLAAAAVLGAAALAPHRTLLAAPGPGTLPRQAANLHAVAALPAYRPPRPPHRAEHRVRATATPAPKIIAAPSPEPAAAPVARQATAAPSPAASPAAPVASPRPAPVRARAPVPNFDSSGAFDSS